MKRLVVFLLPMLCAMAAAAQTQVALTASAPVSLAGTLVTFAATVSGIPSNATAAGATPTGAVTFLDGTTALGQVQLATGNQGLAVANFYTSALSAGSHSITAQYAGDANFKAAVSTPVTIGVDAFSVTPSATTVTVKQGQTATILYTVAGDDVPGASVQFGCRAPANAFSTCFFSPAVLTGNGQTALTIATTGAATTASGGLGLFATGSGSLACLLLCWSPFGGRFRRFGCGALTSALILAVLLCCIAGFSGCGGSSTPAALTASPTGTQAFEVITSTTANLQTVTQDTWITVNVLPGL